MESIYGIYIFEEYGIYLWNLSIWRIWNLFMESIYLKNMESIYGIYIFEEYGIITEMQITSLLHQQLSMVSVECETWDLGDSENHHWRSHYYKWPLPNQLSCHRLHLLSNTVKKKNMIYLKTITFYNSVDKYRSYLRIHSWTKDVILIVYQQNMTKAWVVMKQFWCLYIILFILK